MSRRERGTELGEELTARDELQNEVDVGLGHHHVEQVNDVWMADRLHHLNLRAEYHGERARKEKNMLEMRGAQRGPADVDVGLRASHLSADGVEHLLLLQHGLVHNFDRHAGTRLGVDGILDPAEGSSHELPHSQRTMQRS